MENLTAFAIFAIISHFTVDCKAFFGILEKFILRVFTENVNLCKNLERMEHMDKKQTRLVMAALFAAIIAITVFRNGKGAFVSLGAGIMGGGIYYLVSRFVIDS